ncbi:N-acetylmuramoyl-L-alanine amidase [Streptomyces sp. CFMR 7]|uniref:peptidoglycan recognition protein family protein n=1 Tax=Streptomyces sp. CFMR 7 TaxID=1649184 RepID=UPI0011A01DA2|nr:N-acetylmuramoyl-L-alanine amidase [Streptomyces sp. CFMR 7]
MAWYPGAKKMELQPESDSQPAIRPTQLILHSIVANWTARRTYEFWRDSTNLESHFGIGYGERDIAQYIGTETRADANAGANRRSDGTGAISVETASNSTATDPWNASQVEELIRLGVWAHQRHGIPLRICRTQSDPGFGYHSMFPQWSTSGTACPGPARIKQFREVVFPGIVARATGKTTNEEDPMGITKKDIFDAVWRTDAVPAPATAADRKNNPTWQPQSFLTDIGDKVRSMDARLTAQSAVIDKLVDAVAAGPGADLEALKREIRKAISSIDIHLTTPEA